MADIPKNNQLFALKKITNLYRIALFCYLIPFIFIVLLILDVNTFHATDVLFLVLFFLSTLPLSIIGLISNILGLKLSHRMNHVPKKNIGYANLIIGIIDLMIVLFGLGLAFVMVLQ